MNLNQLKAQLLDPSAQIILFRKDGMLVDSCESLTELEAWKEQSLYDLVPLLKSMEMAFEHIGEEVIDLPCVDFNLNQRHGYYDFTFQQHPEDPELIIWLIKDQTRIYRYYLAIQQERNLLRLEKEYQEHGKSA